MEEEDMASPKYLEHAILGFLNYRPWTGYELKRIFDDSIKHFWPADQSQMYKALSRLADDGYATMEVVHQDDRPSRKVYSITDEGRAELREWIARMPETELYREPFLIQIFFAGMLSDDEIIRILEAKAEELRGELEHLLEESQGKVNEDAQAAPPREQFFWFLTVDCGLWSVRSSLDWIADTIERIRRKEYKDGPKVLPPPNRRRNSQEM